MKLTFYGAAQQVTGSNYLLELDNEKILIDCGLHQGANYSERHNFEPFPYSPKEISAVIVTHPHVDHVGLLPKLYKDGFRGQVYSTPPAKDFANLLLLDSEHILIQSAEHFKMPYLYGVREVEELMARWQTAEYHQPIKVGKFTVTFYNAGHILGSAFVVVEGEIATDPSGPRNDKKIKILFSGDLGNSPAPIIGKREDPPENVDYCVVESTYGNRTHEPMVERKSVLEDMIEDTVKRKGVLMIPAFAMERTQELLYELNELVENDRIPKAPIYLDSPLAIKLTEVYNKHHKYWDAASMKQMKSGDALFKFPGLRMTLTTEESKQINKIPPPKVIIAGAGMSNAGRILHHEQRYLSDSNNTLLIIGYQSAGTLGRRLLDGAKEVSIFGEKVEVHCRIKSIGGYSAHADQPQLLEWLGVIRQNVKTVFLTHGETDNQTGLKQKLIDDLAVNVEIPAEGDSYDII